MVVVVVVVVVVVAIVVTRSSSSSGSIGTGSGSTSRSSSCFGPYHTGRSRRGDFRICGTLTGHDGNDSATSESGRSSNAESTGKPGAKPVRMLRLQGQGAGLLRRDFCRNHLRRSTSGFVNCPDPKPKPLQSIGTLLNVMWSITQQHGLLLQ